jgi:integrase
MENGFTFKKYVEWNVYAVTPIRGKYGFRVMLKFSDGTAVTQQKSGYRTKKEAGKARDTAIAQLYAGTYVAYGKVKVEDYMTYWLEEVMRKRITNESYYVYRNVVNNYIIPQMGNKYMETVNRGTVQSLYQYVAGQSVSVSPLVKTVMGTSMRYAKSKNIISANPTEGVHMPKCVRKKKYREREIDVAKTLNEEQVERLIEGSKGTPVYMQILFAVMMGLRRGEINGLKYSDVDYIHRKLKVQRQLGKKPNTEKEDVPPKMLTKQEIKLKTKSSYRELDIPDMVFEAILEQRKIYEKNRRRRKSEFRDTDYICCSTYGNPRSKSFHYPYYKKILAEQGLPNIRFHDLRSTYATILMKNNFNLKGISNMLGHSKEIISADVYGDTKEIIADCLDVLQPFIEEVLPDARKSRQNDFSRYDIINDVAKNLIF